MTTSNVHYSSKTPEWATPQSVFDSLNKEFKFTLDPAATKQNAKCKKFFTVKEDGLKQSWLGERVFCNPPYGRVIGDWVKKCAGGVLRLRLLYFLLVPIHVGFTNSFTTNQKFALFADESNLATQRILLRSLV